MIAAVDRTFCCLFQFLLLAQLVVAAPEIEQKKGDGSCPTNMDVFRETLKESANEYKLVMEERNGKMNDIMNQMKTAHEQEKLVRFDRMAESAMKNEILATKLHNNNMLVEVMHLVAMFIGDKLENVDKKLLALTEGLTLKDERVQKMEKKVAGMLEVFEVLKYKNMEDTKEKFPVLEGKMEKLEGDFRSAKLEILQKLDALELRGDDIEKTLNSTVLSEIESGFRTVHLKLEAGESNSVARAEQTQDRIQALRVDELAQQVSGVQEKIAFFEENLQSQHHFLEKMDNRTLESFSEVKLRLKKLAGCNRAVKLNLTSLETGTYYFSNFYLNWTRASEFCKKNGMLLATLESEEEMDLLDNAAPNQNYYFWLSGSDAGRQPGHYYWADGRMVDKNWWYRGAQTEPDSFTSGQDTCVFIYTYYGKLFDGACSGNRYFICELLPGCLD